MTRISPSQAEIRSKSVKLGKALFTALLIIAAQIALPLGNAAGTQTRIYEIDYPIAIAGDSAGNIYIGDDHNSNAAKKGLVVVPASTGTLFGFSVTAGVPKLIDAQSDIAGIAVNSAGDLFYSRTNGSIYAFTGTSKTVFGVSVTANTKTLIASGTSLKGPMQFDSAGNLYAVYLATGSLYVLPAATGTLYGTSVTANTAARIYNNNSNWFWDLAIDAADNIYVADGWGLQGVFVMPKISGTLLGQSVTANTFARLTVFGTARYAGIDIDSNGAIFANEYANITRVVSPTNQTVFGQAITANTLSSITDSSGYVDQGIYVMASGAIIEGGPGGTWKLVSGSSGGGGGGGGSSPTAEELAAQARAAYESALADRRTKALNKVNNKISLTVSEVNGIDYGLISEISSISINEEWMRLLAKSQLVQADLKSVIHKYATIEKISSNSQRIYSHDLISIGLISQSEKHKSAILRHLSIQPSSKIDTYEELQLQVAEVQKFYKERERRFAQLYLRYRK